MQTKKKPTRRTFILNSTSINTGDSRLHLENYKLDVIKRNVKFDPGMHPPECNKYREVVKIQFHWNFTARDPSFMRNQCEKGNTHTLSNRRKGKNQRKKFKHPPLGAGESGGIGRLPPSVTHFFASRRGLTRCGWGRCRRRRCASLWELFPFSFSMEKFFYLR